MPLPLPQDALGVVHDNKAMQVNAMATASFTIVA